MSESAPTSATKERLGNLPEWDLTDLYPGPESKELAAEIAGARSDAAAFRARHAGTLDGLSGAELGAAVAAYEAIEERLGRISSYAGLLYAGDMTDPHRAKFQQAMRETVTAISSDLLFFTLELNRIEPAALEEKLADPALARYRPWLRDLRAYRPHQLDDELERLLHEKQVTGRAAWTRLFDESLAGLRFTLDGQTLNETELLDKLLEPDRALRERAGRAFAEGLAGEQRLFALITNTLAKDKRIEDEWRGFARPVSSRNLANFVEDEVVDALATAVRESYPKLSHRYYALKARWLGLDKLAFWDRNAPLPGGVEPLLPWAEAQRIVLDAYASFSPDLAAIGARFFTDGWIDAPVRPGKAPGAFAHPTVPSAHPYILVNYQGRPRDVMTLAHELGHGVHQVLAGPQGHLMADTPLTLAETASVFGEMLTFQALLRRTDDPARRKVLLATKVEDMLNTVVRQIAFHQFETRLHDARAEGEVLAEDIQAIWMETQQEALGPAFEFDEAYRVFWSYIPHFIHVPFYVYAYAFGDCLVNSLYAVYQDAGEGFAERYLEMLRAGGSKRHKELLAPFGLDAADPGFWRKGLGVVEGMIDELEALG
jgi:oligoendopeptidase F